MSDLARLPQALQDAMVGLLDADAETDLTEPPASSLERIDVLRAARAVVYEFRRGRLTVDQAVSRIRALTAGPRAAPDERR